MKLAVDANILVAELVRERGRELVRHEALELYIAEKPWQEAKHELSKRIGHMVRQGRLPQSRGDALLAEGLVLAEERVELVPEDVYAPFEAVARQRIPRDPDDWPTIALALALDAHIWTHDGDFLGCGVAIWTTETLLRELKTIPQP